MADKTILKRRKADRRRTRVRSRVVGTAERPRLTVAKSLNNVFVQVINDETGVTLVGLSSNSPDATSLIADDDTKTSAARKVGKKIAELARSRGIEQVVFDRNIHRYHGRIKAVAEGAREGGLQF